MDQFGFGFDLECSLGPGSLVGNRVKNKRGQKQKKISQQSKQAEQEMKGICLSNRLSHEACHLFVCFRTQANNIRNHTLIDILSHAFSTEPPSPGSLILHIAGREEKKGLPEHNNSVCFLDWG